MEESLLTVALLTGRGNNTLKDKNIREVCGKPLLAYPAEAARKCGFIKIEINQVRNNFVNKHA